MNDDINALVDIPVVALAVRVFAISVGVWVVSTFAWVFTQDAVWKSMADVGAAIVMVELLAAVAVAGFTLSLSEIRWTANRW